jgi:hypothetical protein
MFFSLEGDVFYWIVLLSIASGLSTFLSLGGISSLLGAVALTILIRVFLTYFAPLHIADEGYCRGDMTKIEAFFGLLFMGFIIVMVVYCLIIQPFILGVPSCKRFF